MLSKNILLMGLIGILLIFCFIIFGLFITSVNKTTKTKNQSYNDILYRANNLEIY